MANCRPNTKEIVIKIDWIILLMILSVLFFGWIRVSRKAKIGRDNAIAKIIITREASDSIRGFQFF